MPRPSNTAERRKQISRALVRVMADHGYHRATIAKIAKEAGLASGLVLYHFESKAAILIDAVESLVATFELRYSERIARAGDDPRERIDAFVDAQLALGDDADESVVSAWVVIAAQAVQNPDVRDAYAASVDTRLRDLEALVRAARKADGKPTRGARRIAAGILSAIEGSFLLSAAAPGTLPRGYAAPAVRAMVDGLMAS